MRGKRVAFILLMALLAVAFAAQPAMAQYEGTGSLSGSATSGGPGSSITITGSGFEPGETVNVFFDDTLIATTTADENGNISVTITIPDDASVGTHTISAVGASSGRTLTMSFTVTGAGGAAAITGAGAGEGQLGLAFTGATLLFWILSGLALVGLGISVIKGRSSKDDSVGSDRQ